MAAREALQTEEEEHGKREPNGRDRFGDAHDDVIEPEKVITMLVTEFQSSR